MGRVYSLPGRERKCRFCGRVFRSIQGVRGHLRSCSRYELGAEPAELRSAEVKSEVVEASEVGSVRLRGVSPEVSAEVVEVPSCLLSWAISAGRLAGLSFGGQNEMALALREGVEELDPLILDRLREDENLCWSFFVEFAHRQLAGREAVAEIEASLPSEPGKKRWPLFDFKAVLAEVRRSTV